MSNTDTITTEAEHAEELANARATLRQRQEAHDEAEQHEQDLWDQIDAGDDSISAQKLSNARINTERTARLLAAAERAVKRLERTAPGQSWLTDHLSEHLEEELGFPFTAGAVPSSTDSLVLPHGFLRLRKAAPAAHGGYAGPVVADLTILRGPMHRASTEAELAEALASSPRITGPKVAQRGLDKGDRQVFTVEAMGIYPELPALARVGKSHGPNLGPVQSTLYSHMHSTHMATVEVTSRRNGNGQPRSPIIKQSEPVERGDGTQLVEVSYEVAIAMMNGFTDLGPSVLRRTVEALEAGEGRYASFLGRCESVQCIAQPHTNGRSGHSVIVTEYWVSATA